MYMYSIIDHEIVILIIINSHGHSETMITVSLCTPRLVLGVSTCFPLEDSSMGSSPDSSTILFIRGVLFARP